MPEKYRPCNGSEGDWFTGQFCDQCAHDAKWHETENPEDGCQIFFRTMIHNTDHEEYPSEWTYDENGKPTCTKFLPDTEKVKERCGRTSDMFEQGNN